MLITGRIIVNIPWPLGISKSLFWGYTGLVPAVGKAVYFTCCLLLVQVVVGPEVVWRSSVDWGVQLDEGTFLKRELWIHRSMPLSLAAWGLITIPNMTLSNKIEGNLCRGDIASKHFPGQRLWCWRSLFPNSTLCKDCSMSFEFFPRTLISYL